MSMGGQPKLSSMFELEYPQSVGVYDSYAEAQKAVDYLSDNKFAVQNLCIVGTDLKSVERVLGRRNWGTVLGQGVQSGISTGLLVALLMWFLAPTQNLYVLLPSALVIGILIGVVFAVIGYLMTRGQRDFTSVSQTVATKYEVLSEHKVAAEARQLLAAMPGARAAQFDPRNQPPVGQQAWPGSAEQRAWPAGAEQQAWPGTAAPADPGASQQAATPQPEAGAHNDAGLGQRSAGYSAQQNPSDETGGRFADEPDDTIFRRPTDESGHPTDEPGRGPAQQG